MLQRVAFTMYPVEDTQRARAFYEATLGLQVGSHSNDGMWTEYDLPGGGCFALGRTGGKPSAESGGTIALEVEDLDAEVARLREQGVTFLHDMINSPVCRMSIIRDSEGNAIILHELKRTKG
jgi:predicted enzyme related to lactoylglutathione lyase